MSRCLTLPSPRFRSDKAKADRLLRSVRAPVRLVPVGKLTFPDQQQDLQNAAGFSLASECDGNVNFPRVLSASRSAAIWLPRMGWGGLGVSEVTAAFVISPAIMPTDTVQALSLRSTVQITLLGSNQVLLR